MRNKVTDAIIESSLELLYKEGYSFQTYIFTANELTHIPPRLQINLRELILSRNQIRSINLYLILQTFVNIEVLDLS